MPDTPTPATADGGTDVDVFVAAWTPTDPTDTEVLDAARSAVTAAGPRSRREARNALRYATAYLTHRTGTGDTLDPDTAFAAEPVDEYRRNVLVGATGTRAAVASHLKRLHPAVGFTGTTRQHNKAPGPAAVTELRPAPALDPAAITTIDTWTPTNVADERWDRIADVCRRAVTAARPARPGRARDLLRSAAYLTAWADARHTPLRTDVIFTAAQIEMFIAAITGSIADRSAATHASNLHAIRTALGLPLDTTRRTFPTGDDAGPYTTADIDTLYRHAERLPTADRRRHVTAALDLLLGAGATPAETAHARPEHVTSHDDGTVTVTFDRVAVPVAADHANTLAQAAADAEASGDTYLIGGGPRNRPNRVNQIFAANDRGMWGVPVDTTRARHTWLVDAAAHQTSITALLRTARLSTLAVLDKLLPHIEAVHDQLTERINVDEFTADSEAAGDTSAARVDAGDTEAAGVAGTDAHTFEVAS